MIPRFLDDNHGVAATEFALILPLLLALLLGTITIFDLFRMAQRTQKATFTIGDILSRQSAIDDSIIEEMQDLLENTIDAAGDSNVRVSSISMTGGALVLDWSKPQQTNGTAADRDIPYSVIPDMADGDSVILVESFVPHVAIVSGFGIDELTYENHSVHRPRFVGRIAFQE
ncbi:TadE/TadG family type IV pilus assembly protein [Devosia sp. 1635]|uniref:TadE/TadG family type IV pilus assembly protein n=1 Tax=Devosia sp. 1635 TaxID=2726066 RepID=UPI0015646268|nr:TadE/TadG family type IV pilus assembly protein [Devosia sp. 1635]